MNEVKFKANKKDLKAIQEATAALDTTDTTAGQVLKVETPGEAPVWGEAGGGGGGASYVEFTTTGPDVTPTTTATFAEVKALADTGALVGVLKMGDQTVTLTMVSSTQTHVDLIGCMYESGALIFFTVHYRSSGTVVWYIGTVATQPFS